MPSHLLPRLGTLFVGIILLSFAISLSIRSDIGTSPISSVPYVYSLILPLSVGTLTILMQIVMLILQMLILGKQFQWFQWLQLPTSIVFGLAIDVMLWLTEGLYPSSYFEQLLMCLSNCFITAIAVCLMVRANLIMMAVDATYLAICQRWGFNFGKCKMWGDITLVIVALSSIWFATANVTGIGEGTVISAVVVGTLIRYLMPYFDRIQFAESQASSVD